MAWAGMLQTVDNQKYEGSVRFAETGEFLVETPAGAQHKLPFEKVRVAQFGLVSDGNLLPQSWLAENIGHVQGNSTEKDGRFTLRVTGGAVPDLKRFQAVHCAYRWLRTDGELVARVENVSGKQYTLGGLILRENLETTSGYVLLGVTPENTLHLQVREANWGPLNKKALGSVSLPIWLKLVRQEKTVVAYRSPDGKNWQKLDQVNLSQQKEPFPEGSGDWKPKLLAGLAVTGPCTNTLNSARFDQVSVSIRSLLGMYFADEQFEAFRFSRPDPELKFYWHMGSPAPDIPLDHFSVRWLGNLEPQTSGKYRIFYDAEGPARLWLDGKELTSANYKSSKEKNRGQELQLRGGQKYALKFEYQAGEGEAHSRLVWSGPGISEQHLTAPYLSYTYTTNSPVEYSEAARTNLLHAKGLWLRNGTFIAGQIRSADDTFTRVVFAGTNELVILNSKIARIVFRRIHRPLPLEKTGGRPGLILKGGDFFESDYKGVKDRSLIVSSVLFGQKKFSLEAAELSALVLSNDEPGPAPLEVRLLDGSVLRAQGFRPIPGGALVEESLLGEIKIPTRELSEIRRTGPAVSSVRASRG